MIACRYCGGSTLARVLDLGSVPAADHFPERGGLAEGDEAYPLAMLLCADCVLAQLEVDDTATEEPKAVEPQSLRDQAADAIERVAAAGLLTGESAYEFGSPHGGSWMDLIGARGLRPVQDGPADVVLDSFGMMHDADQAAAIRLRAECTKPDGILLLQVHPVETILVQRQWNSLRHGHFAYYSLSVLRRMLGDCGMAVVAVWEFDLYGGTLLVAARHGAYALPDSARTVLKREHAAGVLGAQGFAPLQEAVDIQVRRLTDWLGAKASAGERVYAYGASSRVVALFALAGLSTATLSAVADASSAKQGRRMPGTDIPIIAPAQLISARPDYVLLTLSDLYDEVRVAFPELEGRWVNGFA
ncbi:class I SAM-dependent methyltransferase [Mycobacteroides abscessus]|nr:class I SAM-dependent methyltransferase [Mycobacteroides abscessus]MDM1906696.1 class I SAM-dependent methyltransferase [Mycobacteroides abscessus]MDM1911381.1 class I SAM-dependent methyltransferase [Mycobacteroides abscessus]MDM1921291.1 class I SAM-dependent methyltransferase [Mycobacteroides abscessus]